MDHAQKFDEGVAAPSSHALFERARAGDRHALESLFARELPQLYRYARGRLPRWARSVAHTADLVQDTFMRMIGSLERFDPRRKDALRAYLRRAVANRVVDEVRRARRQPCVTGLDEADVARPTCESPFEQALGVEATRRYRAALARLSREDQEAILGRVSLGYSFEQLGLVSGRRTADSARMAFNRSLFRLAQEMARVEAKD